MEIYECISAMSYVQQIKLEPVLKLMTISQRKMVSETTLKMILLVERSSLKKEMATGRMMRLATRSNSMQRSQ